MINNGSPYRTFFNIFETDIKIKRLINNEQDVFLYMVIILKKKMKDSKQNMLLLTKKILKHYMMILLMGYVNIFQNNLNPIFTQEEVCMIY